MEKIRTCSCPGYCDFEGKQKCHCELFDWLSKQDGMALVNDDFGHWAVATSGMQNVPRNPPDDIQTTFFIEKAEWKDSIEEAIKYAMQEQD